MAICVMISLLYIIFYLTMLDYVTAQSCVLFFDSLHTVGSVLVGFSADLKHFLLLPA